MAVILNQEIRELERKQEQLVQVQLKHCQMSVSKRLGLKFQSSVLLNTPSRNGKYGAGAKCAAACLLFPLLLKAAQQLLLS